MVNTSATSEPQGRPTNASVLPNAPTKSPATPLSGSQKPPTYIRPMMHMMIRTMMGMSISHRVALVLSTSSSLPREPRLPLSASSSLFAIGP